MRAKYAVTTRDVLRNETEHATGVDLETARVVARELASEGSRATIWGPLDPNGEGEIVETHSPEG